MDFMMTKSDNKDRLCLGIYYRCRVSFYCNQKGVFNQRVKMTPLKSYSCRCQCQEGSRPRKLMCDEDWWVECMSNESIDDLIEMPASPEDGGLYQLKCIYFSDEEWEWKFVQVDEALFHEHRYKIESTW